jgi:adenylate kinase
MTVVDTHVPDAVPREHVRKVIVLRCHPKVLEARLRRKGWMGSKIRENLLAEILDSCYVTAVDYHGARKTDQLDTSRVSLSKCVSQAKRILTKQAAGKVRVDWIGVLSRERSLEKYLR